MPTYRLVVEYAGTRYSGWQEQKNALTVAGELRRAIEGFAGPVLELGGAGRTDAGVHALGQVAHVRLERALDARELLRGTNERLPADVNVLEARAVDERFHARHHALTRTYVYQIAKRRTAFGKRHVWWIEAPLDVARMSAAAASCLGEHDFAVFSERAKDGDDTTARMDRAEVVEHGSLVLVRFEASNFQWRMVRRLTGALVQVGLGKISPADFEALVHARAAPHLVTAMVEGTAPASGLFLARVRYAGDPPLGELLPVFPIDPLFPVDPARGRPHGSNLENRI